MVGMMNIENAPFEVVASGNPHPDATFFLEENVYSEMGKQILVKLVRNLKFLRNKMATRPLYMYRELILYCC